MSNPHGSFIWYELLTSDTAAAGAFYADLLDWQISSFPDATETDATETDATETGATETGAVEGYKILSHGEDGIGGMLKAPDGVPPGWVGYIGVEDVDATIAGITQAGGKVMMPARDLPEIGRIAMLTDPQGAPFYVMRGASDRSSTSYNRDAVGHCAWNELGGSDLDAAIAFYAGQFGWTRGELLKMGDRPGYQLMELAGQGFGAITVRPGGMPPMWMFYFRVAKIEVAAQRARDAGASILHGPADVPGGDRIIIGTDPQGAAFALVGKSD